MLKSDAHVNPMNILHLSFADNSGGAARSAYKIHSGIRELGLTSRMLVGWKVTKDPDVDYLKSQDFLIRVGDAIGRKVVDRLNLPYLYNPSSFKLIEHPWFKSADLIQLYNLHAPSCFFTYRALPQISRYKPIVWRLSDMWPFTGHCSYSHECDRWKTGCGACPYLNEYPALTQDTTALLWRIKKSVYQRSKLVIIATNSWMENLVKESPLLGHFPIYRIPNGIDPEIFHPLPKIPARSELNIPQTAKVVLFAAYDLTEPRKGSQYVLSAMEKVAASGVKDLVLVVMGKGAELWENSPNYQTIRLKFTSKDKILTQAYSSADVFLHPAIVENFPNSILESMACGTPCVAFNTGGVADILHHLETGYLAEYKDESDLAKGVKILLENSGLHSRLSRNCHQLINLKYTLENQAKSHIDLYSEIVDRHSLIK